MYTWHGTIGMTATTELAKEIAANIADIAEQSGLVLPSAVPDACLAPCTLSRWDPILSDWPGCILL